ncbi:MAG: carboxypeptidase-like regulatory domain-containing protein [Bacteroidales bacterium]|nr:carboxypeptidase-like regulatory domain-containing protein [Bacteroidales bacterium]
MSFEDLFFLHFRKIVLAGVGVMGLLVFNFAGCPGFGDSTGTLAGQVTSGGKPVLWGTVTVIGSDNRPRTATIRPDGTYEVRGLPPGPVRVAVQSANPNYRIGSAQQPRSATQPSPSRTGTNPRPIRGTSPVGNIPTGGRKMPNNMQAFAMEMEQPTNAPQPRASVPGWFPVPGKYANPATSGLQTTVTDGSAHFHIRVD